MLMLDDTRRNVALIILMGAILLLTGNSLIFITDPVESNYTQSALEMLESGDWVSPRIYGNFWYDKPVFFYWELIAAFQLFGVNEFAARLFPALFGIVGLLMTYFFASRIYDQRTGFMSSVILCTIFEYWLISKTVITDSTLFVFFNGVLIAFYLAYTGNKNWYYLCYIFSGLAVLTKGPIGILLPGFIMTLFICIRRDFREVLNMKPQGFILWGLVVASWYYPMYQLHGSDFIDTFLGVHNVLRATVSEHPMWDVWWYYSAMFIIGCMPWSFIALKPIFHFIVDMVQDKRLPRMDTTTMYLLLWALTVNVFFQCMATKYTTYTLPAVLPIAILLARYLSQRQKLFKRMAWGCMVLYISLCFVAAYGCSDVSNSAKGAVETVHQHQQARGLKLNNEISRAGYFNDEKDIFVTYGIFRASSAFYSHYFVIDLHPQETLNEVNPAKMSWTSTNVMRKMAIEDLPMDKGVYLLLNKRKFDDFEQRFDGEWQLLEDYGSERLYYRPAK